MSYSPHTLNVLDLFAVVWYRKKMSESHKCLGHVKLHMLFAVVWYRKKKKSESHKCLGHVKLHMLFAVVWYRKKKKSESHKCLGHVKLHMLYSANFRTCSKFTNFNGILNCTQAVNFIIVVIVIIKCLFSADRFIDKPC